MAEISNEIDTLIEEQQREMVSEYASELWDSAVTDGLDPEIVAEVVIEKSLQEIAKSQGNKAVSRLISHFSKLERLGFLPGSQTLQ